MSLYDTVQFKNVHLRTINEEQCDEQPKLKVTTLRIDKAELKREGENQKREFFTENEKKKSPPSHTKKVLGKGGAKNKNMTLILLNTNSY